MPKIRLSPQDDWALIVPHDMSLPLPSEVRWVANIPGVPLKLSEIYQASPGDHLITAKKKNKNANWGFVYSLYAIHPVEDKLVRIPYGILHKTIIKKADGTKDLIPGAGALAAIVREIHAIRRGIIKLGLEPRSIYPTRYQRSWVI